MEGGNETSKVTEGTKQTATTVGIFGRWTDQLLLPSETASETERRENYLNFFFLPSIFCQHFPSTEPTAEANGHKSCESELQDFPLQ